MAKKPPLFLEDIHIYEAGARGKGVGRSADGRVVFVTGAVPGDTCTVRVQKLKKQFAEGVATEITVPSPHRVKPVCEHFGTCGGCKWQNLEYSQQLIYKEEEVKNQLLRHAKLEVEEFIPILPADPIYEYRNKLEFSFCADRWLTEAEIEDREAVYEYNALGFHVPGRWDKVLQVNRCHLQPEPSNAIRNAIHRYALAHGITYYHPRKREGHLRTLLLRNSAKGEWMLAIQCFEDKPEERSALLNHLVKEFPQLTSVFYAINPKANDSWYDLDPVLFHGREHLLEEMPAYWPDKAPLQFRVGLKSFYQTNAGQAYRLYASALDLAEVQPGHTVYDLYTGTGTIALFMAQRAGKVIGLEAVPEAVEDAKRNAELNSISHASFHAGDMKNLLSEDFFREHGRPDVLVTDPPRDGMHPKVVELLNQSGIPRIVYVSCNPATQARDLALMKDFYRVKRSQAVDMFPHTFHVENVVLLEKR